ARPDEGRAEARVGPLPAPPDLAWPPRLHRPATALRALRAERPLPVEPGLARGQRDQQAAVVVVRREEVAADGLADARARAQLELLAHPSDAPLERELRRVPGGLEAGEPERLDDVCAEQRLLRIA